MRLLVRLLGTVSVLTLVAGALWAFAVRNDREVAGPVALLVAGTAAALAAAGLYALAERRPAGLVLAPESRLPLPAWWAPVGAAGLVDLVAGPFVSVPVTVAGAVLVAAAALGLGLDLRDGREIGRDAVRAARSIREFGARHAGAGDAAVDAVVEHFGRRGGRIVLLGRDGAFGDLVLGSVAGAEQAVRLAGATRHDGFPPDLVGRFRTGRYEWERMAGIQLGGSRG
jgi:hypothetical protein